MIRVLESVGEIAFQEHLTQREIAFPACTPITRHPDIRLIQSQCQ